MFREKIKIKSVEFFGLLSFFFGLTAIFFEIVFLINLMTLYFLTSDNFLGDIFIFLFRALFQHGGYFVLTFLGVIFGLIGLKSSKRKRAKEGIILSVS
jgi:uncharacterized membrane protein